MSASLQKSLAEQAELIRSLRKRAAADVIEIGRLLLECHRQVPHGYWLPWLEKEFGWSLASAERIMRVARVFGDGKFVNLTNLEPSSLYLLAAKSTPSKAVEYVNELAGAGRVTHKAVVRIVRDAKPAPMNAEASSSEQDKPPAAIARAVSQIINIGPDCSLDDLTEEAVAQAIGDLTKIASRLRSNNRAKAAADVEQIHVDIVADVEVERQVVHVAPAPTACTIDLALDSPGPLQGIPDFLRRPPVSP